MKKLYVHDDEQKFPRAFDSVEELLKHMYDVGFSQPLILQADFNFNVLEMDDFFIPVPGNIHNFYIVEIPEFFYKPEEMFRYDAITTSI